MAARGGLRRALIKAREAVEDWVVAARSDLYAQRIVYLARFGEPHEYERFQVTTDRVLGGNTQCSFTLKQYPHFSAGLFEGVIDYHDGNPQSRGGFASFRTKPDEKERRLGAYAALEMRVKTDGRPYILNVKCAEVSPEHLWQMRIVTPPFRWTTVALPFDELMFTRRGRVELEQREIDKDCINGFGILLADGRNGPFKFEIQHLRALAEFDPAAYTSAPEQMMQEQRRLEEGPAKLQSGTGSTDFSQYIRQPARPARAPSSAARDVSEATAATSEAGLLHNNKEEVAGQPPSGGAGGKTTDLREYYRQMREAAKLK